MTSTPPPFSKCTQSGGSTTGRTVIQWTSTARSGHCQVCEVLVPAS